MANQLRTLVGFALEPVTGSSQIRTLLGFALESIKDPLPDFTLEGPAALLKAINRENAQKWTTEHVSLDAPRALTGDTRFNTTCLVRAKAASGYSGSYTIRYNRFDLLVGTLGKALTGYTPTEGTVYGQLAAINTFLGLKLTEADLTDAPVASGARTVTLTVKEGSYLFIPGSSITLGTA